MLKEFDIGLDLTEIFSFKKSPICSPDLRPIKHIWEYKYYWSSKMLFNMMNLKQNWSLSNQNG